MPVAVILPKVDMDMESGLLARWHVEEGAWVEKGQPLFDIETDKAAMEVEAEGAGRIEGRVPEGSRLPVGSTVAWRYGRDEVSGPVTADAGGASAPAAPSAPDLAEAGTREERVRGASVPAAPSAGAPRLVAATPAARAVARAAGLELRGLTGSGPRGRIQRADVEAQLSEPQPPAGFEAGTGPLYLARRPGRGTPILFLHGFASEGGSWFGIERLIPGDRPTLRLDLPCHGRSPLRRVQGFAELARLVTEAFDAALPGQAPVHLVAHSLGGGLALALADIRPRQVQSLTVIAPAGLGPEIDGATLTGLARASRAESLGPWLRRLTARPETITDDYVRAALATRRDPALRAAQGVLAEALFPDGTQAFDLRPALSRLTCPAQILWGRQDQVVPWRQALAAGGETALHLIPEAGHLPQVEAPDLVARLCARLIALAEAAPT